MRPRKLLLENVGPFVGRTEVDFDALGDIFLISGKTGSGKTTIFDSLCYALYGTLPGGRRGQTRKLRSDFSGEEDNCSVSLDFDLGDRTYRVERTPPRQRKKTRGDGFAEVPETAILYEKRNGIFEQLSGKKSDADERIVKLIGLSFDEFSKIVILPQGEFAEFLKQNSNERRDVLRKLFPVDHAVRARELAADRAKAAKARLEEAERAFKDAAARFDADAYESLRARSEERVREAAERATALEAEREKLNGELRAAAAEKETAESLGRAREAERTLDEREAEITVAERKLAASRKAKPLAPLLRREKEAREAEDRAREAVSAAKRKFAAAEKRSLEMEMNKPRADEAEKEIARLREKRGPIAEAAADEKELSRLRSEVLAVRKREAEALAEKNAAEETARSRSQEIAKLRAAAGSAAELDAAWESAREAMEKARALKPLAERAERLKNEVAEGETAKTGLAADITARRAEEPILKAELEEIERMLREADLSGSAAALAAGLRSGNPCPVCGSLEHPKPAGAAAPAFDLLARRDVRRRNAEDAAKTLAAKTAELKALESRLERLDREREEIAEQAACLGTLPESAAEAVKRLAVLSEAATTALVPRTEAKKAGNRLELLYGEAEKHDEMIKRIEAARSAAASERAAFDAAIAEKEKRQENALIAGGNAASAAEALAAIDGRVAAREEERARYKEEREAAASDLSASEAAAKAAGDALATASAASEKASQDFASQLSRSPFADEDGLRAAFLENAEESRLEIEIPAWKEERSRSRTRREELEKSLEKIRGERRRPDGTPPPEAGELEAALERNQRERNEAGAERDAAIAEENSLERDRNAYEEAKKRYGSLSQESALIRALADDLSGINPKKRSFDAWLLAAYLSEVAAFAARRLERMSEGRYRLLLDEDREAGNARTGLDLAVFDAYTGRARPCATLSGGESFMASISLALGLADSIQARSGGVRLDAVFIDEGFGSLDEASLDKALGILDEIRDHRMVGLISHVGEMKNRIPNRVEIVKTNSGSRVTVSPSVS